MANETDQIFKLRRLRSGSAARLAGWEQISTVDEEDNDDTLDKKKGGNISVITVPGGPLAKGQATATTAAGAAVAARRQHNKPVACTAKINNSSGIIIKSLINQNELLRQDNIHSLNFVNKTDYDKTKSVGKKSDRKTLLTGHHVKFTCPRIKIPSPLSSQQTTGTTTPASSLSPSTSKLNEWIPLKGIFDLHTNSKVSSVKPSFSQIDVTPTLPPSTTTTNNLTVISNNNNSTPIIEINDVSTVDTFDHILRVPILGNRQSGKTTLVKQFINCIDPGNPIPTRNRPVYYDPMISFNDRLYHVRLIDCPPIEKKFPTNSVDEWESYRGWGLRNATAFILVFDVNSESSFQYIRHLRDQIIAEFNDIPLLLVANKIDLLQQTTSGLNSSHFIPSFYSSSSTSSSGVTASTPGLSQSTTSTTNSSYRYNIRRDINIIIKKQWKRTVLVECSAKYNWHVMNVFKELMRILENREQAHKATAARAVQNALRNNQCSIM
uniref:Ras-like protein family member 10B n=1 Tax=Trichobilharzia regenti TaxID=157069 RepID=A0AA85K7D6_TRIRE|nr:unnamed protein product [Trichobilharzia regenti]